MSEWGISQKRKISKPLQNQSMMCHAGTKLKNKIVWSSQQMQGEKKFKIKNVASSLGIESNQ